MKRLALLGAVAALSGCAIGTVSGTTLRQLSRSMTLGVIVHCTRHCTFYPANVDNSPAPGERAAPGHP